MFLTAFIHVGQVRGSSSEAGTGSPTTYLISGLVVVPGHPEQSSWGRGMPRPAGAGWPDPRRRFLASAGIWEGEGRNCNQPASESERESTATCTQSGFNRGCCCLFLKAGPFAIASSSSFAAVGVHGAAVLIPISYPPIQFFLFSPGLMASALFLLAAYQASF